MSIRKTTKNMHTSIEWVKVCHGVVEVRPLRNCWLILIHFVTTPVCRFKAWLKQFRCPSFWLKIYFRLNTFRSFGSRPILAQTFLAEIMLRVLPQCFSLQAIVDQTISDWARNLVHRWSIDCHMSLFWNEFEYCFPMGLHLFDPGLEVCICNEAPN